MVELTLPDQTVATVYSQTHTGNLGGSIGAGADIPSLFLPANTPVMSMENAQGKTETVSLSIA
jgi:hypothetical protein